MVIHKGKRNLHGCFPLLEKKHPFKQFFNSTQFLSVGFAKKTLAI